jgi:hypothetical protein
MEKAEMIRTRSVVLLTIIAMLSLLAFNRAGGPFQAAASQNIQADGWETLHQSFTLKDKEVRLSLSYPKGWTVIAHPEGFIVHLQNTPPFDHPAKAPGGLREGFVKISFMVDPKAREPNLSGREVQIAGLLWRETIESGGIAGDQSLTLETSQDGIVFRIYAYITGTQNQRPLLEYHLETVRRIIQSFQFETSALPERPSGTP